MREKKLGFQDSMSYSLSIHTYFKFCFHSGSGQKTNGTIFANILAEKISEKKHFEEVLLEVATGLHTEIFGKGIF